VGAQILAIALALGTPARAFWPALGWLSLAAQWTALPAAATVCLLRARLAPLDDRLGAALVLVLVVTLAAAVYLAGRWLLGQPPDAAGLARQTALAGLVGALVLRYLHLAHRARERALAAGRARLAVLQARMQPHFLFNSLNTIAALTAQDPARAEEATVALAELLRASLEAGDEPVALAQELAICRRYLEIETLRLGPRLKVQWEGDDIPTQATLPALTLQPLLENAVRHGIEPLPGGGTVRIAFGQRHGRLWIEIENPLPKGGREPGGARMAHENLRERLRTLYGPGARLRTDADAARYRARLEIPVGRLP
jgi:two-component system, LytTR family, sensor histidine kinase AlgZ